MKTQRHKKKTGKLLSLMLALVMIFAGLNLSVQPAQAATGSVYTCSIVPSYRHPLTGTVEDSGGESSYATGQGMVNGCVYSTGILEVTSDGKYYLTIRMSLMDYTSGHNFQVQTTGDSGWSKTVYGQTSSGSDSNGNTADICIQVPSEKCIIRASMYVEPMGRDVIFYIYPNNFQAGNSTNMNATMVTASANSDASASQSTQSASGSESASTAQSGQSNETTQSSAQSSSQSSAVSGSISADSSSLSTGNLTSGQGLTADASTDGTTTDGETTTPTLGNNDMTGAQTDTTQNSSEINSAEGLSLSTATDADSDDDGTTGTSGSGTYTVGEQIAIRMIPPLVVGVVLIAAAAAVVYYFRRNWYRWGGGEDDDDDEE